MADPRVEAALAVLVKAWDEEPDRSTPAGDRVFIRWVDEHPDDPGWDDWTLVGIVRDGVVHWNTDNPGYLDRITKAVAGGSHAGRFRLGEHMTFWWCRSTLDGPPGERTADWMKEE
jgi:hypothetical protein